MKTMAEVLRQVAKDHRHVHTYRGGAQGCSCGQRDPEIIGNNAWMWVHVAEMGAAALAAAGYGPVREAAAEAWDEAHFGATGCDGSDCKFMHGAPESDMNPYRATP